MIVCVQYVILWKITAYVCPEATNGSFGGRLATEKVHDFKGETERFQGFPREFPRVSPYSTIAGWWFGNVWNIWMIFPKSWDDDPI